MTTIQDHSDVRLILRQFGKEHSQLFVRQIKSTGFAAVVTDKSFVHAIGIELLKRLRRFPSSAMAAVLENDDIVGFGLAKVRAKLLDDIGSCGVCVFENFDPQQLLVKVVGEVAEEMIDVVDAARQLANGWRIVIDSDK